MFRIICWCLALSFAASAQGTGSFKKVQDLYNSISGFEVSVSIDGLGGSGKLFHKKENKTRVDFKNMLIVSDGKTTWNLQKSAKKVIISAYDEQDASLLSFNKIMTYYPSVSQISEAIEDGRQIITLTSKKATTHFSTIICVLNKDFTLQKISLTDRGGNKQSILFAGWKLTAPDEQLFTPGELKGVKIIDLR
ncbi:MAG: outer membrane lipoprotein carrier protein LolA [Ignavibacteriales bacterium]|nr:outer membrane lipoprotein carrier protein LolA [Ignavibacteriales bacterium]